VRETRSSNFLESGSDDQLDGQFKAHGSFKKQAKRVRQEYSTYPSSSAAEEDRGPSLRRYAQGGTRSGPPTSCGWVPTLDRTMGSGRGCPPPRRRRRQATASGCGGSPPTSTTVAAAARSGATAPAPAPECYGSYSQAEHVNQSGACGPGRQDLPVRLCPSFLCVSAVHLVRSRFQFVLDTGPAAWLCRLSWEPAVQGGEVLPRESAAGVWRRLCVWCSFSVGWVLACG
jgi:hypothetical protein